jgi:hypothetical protein
MYIISLFYFIFENLSFRKNLSLRKTLIHKFEHLKKLDVFETKKIILKFFKMKISIEFLKKEACNFDLECIFELNIKKKGN